MVCFSLRVGSGIGPFTWAPVRFAVSTIFLGGTIDQTVIETFQPDSNILIGHLYIASTSGAGP
jgi:hypothetical protein